MNTDVKGDTPYARAKELMDRLRAECPWDREQTFESIAKYTIEEAYEVVDAIEQNDMVSLKDELGDLLLQVLFHSKMAEETGAFNMDDVTDGIVEKMVRRHPHVFDVQNGGDKDIENVPDNWEKLKETERKAKGVSSRLDGVALGLPALMRAEKLQKRAAKVGFDWPNVDQVWNKLDEETLELKQAITSGDESGIEDELGDMFFTLVNLSRKLNVDPEVALRKANAKFTKRFKDVEVQAGEDMTGYSLEELEAFWVAAKTSR